MGWKHCPKIFWKKSGLDPRGWKLFYEVLVKIDTETVEMKSAASVFLTKWNHCRNEMQWKTVVMSVPGKMKMVHMENGFDVVPY